MNELKVYVFGDSACFGQHLSPHKVWVTQIAARLDRLSEDKSGIITVQNRSVNGDTTRLALERMPRDIQAYRPDILIVQFGMNDCNYWETDCGVPRVSPEAFHANLVEIIRRAQHCGTQRVFLHTNHLSTRNQERMAGGTGPTFQENNCAYNKIIREVATESLITHLVDIELTFDTYLKEKDLPLAHLLMSDGIHANDIGNSLYIDAVIPDLVEAVMTLIG